jgi:hypothetical protein
MRSVYLIDPAREEYRLRALVYMMIILRVLRNSRVDEQLVASHGVLRS